MYLLLWNLRGCSRTTAVFSSPSSFVRSRSAPGSSSFAAFCHQGFSLHWLSHLLGIPAIGEQHGLEAGADDYITKPFGTAELLARVRASLRINRMNLQASIPRSVFTLGDLEIDYDRRQVSVDGEVVNLTQTEFNIMALLACERGS